MAQVLADGEGSPWWQARERALLEARKRRVRIPVRRETELYGREDNLALLEAAWQRALDGRGNTVLLEGEAGIGKSRLVDAFLSELDSEGSHVLYGSYAPSGGMGAISDALVEHFGHADLEDALRPHLTVTPSLVPALAAVLKGEVPPEGAPSIQGDVLHTVCVHLMRSLAKERPLVWVIEDLHFADADSRKLVLSLARAAAGHPILLCLTTRPGLPEDELAHFSRLESLKRSSLGRLGAREVILLLQDAFRSERLADKLGARIALKSDGVPFFVFEMIRGLREGQFITQLPDGSWIESKVIDDIEVPSSVIDLINARMKDLSREDRDLLDLASCCGFEFDPGLIADAAGVARISALQRIGQVERAHGLVRSRGRTYAFDHHQVQEVLYLSLNEQLREAYHASIAGVLEARGQTAEKDPEALDGSLCVDLCQHFLKGAQGGRARRYLDAALDHLAQGFLNDQMLTLADRALAVSGLLQGGDRLGVLLRKNLRLDLLGRREAQEEVLGEAQALADESGDKAHLARVEQAMGILIGRSGRHEDAQAHFQRHLSLAREIGDRQGEAAATGSLGGGFWYLDRFDEAKTHLERHLEIAREIGDREREGRATGNLGLVYSSLGRLEEAKMHQERSLEIAREIGDRVGECAATGNLGSVFLCLGRFEEAKTRHERHLEIAREIGDRQGEARAMGNLGLVCYSLKRFEEARAHFERLLEFTREIGYRQGEATALVNLGLVCLALGDRTHARSTLEESLTTCRESGAREVEGVALSALGAVAHEEDEGASALDLATRALALRREIDSGDGVANSLLQLGEFHLWAEREGDAEEVLHEAVHLLRQQQRKAGLAQALALLANLPDGDAEIAEAALHDAGEDGYTSGTRYYVWKATGKTEYLAEAKRLLDDCVQHAPEEYRESMLKNVRLHREIMEAWAEHGEEAVGEGDAY